MGRDAPEMKFMYNISYNTTIYNKHYVILAPFRFKQPAENMHWIWILMHARSSPGQEECTRLAGWLSGGSTRLCRRALHRNYMDL